MCTRFEISYALLNSKTSNEFKSQNLDFFILFSRFEKKLACLIDVQWAVIMAEVIFKLLHPKDELSLPQIGITVDPDHPKAPLIHKMQHHLRKYIRDSYKDPYADPLCSYLVKTLQLKVRHTRVMN